MEPIIEVIDGDIFYTIPDLDIEIQLSDTVFFGLCAEDFSNEASSDYWGANWERIEEEVLNHLSNN